MAFQDSEYQIKIYDEIKDIVATPRTGRNMAVKADAGTGKTTTIQKAISFIPVTEQVLYLAYNTHIADDYRPKASSNTEVRTTHSHGFKGILSTIKYGQKKEVVMDEFKVPNLVRNMLDITYPELGEENIKLLRPTIPKLVSHLKSTLLPPNAESIIYLTEKYDNLENYDILMENNNGKKYTSEDGTIYEVNAELITKMCVKILSTCLKAFLPNESCSIDFDDQFWLPLVRPDIKVKKFPWVIIDEAQDLNPAQMKLVMMSVTPNGTIIIVGDPHQSIYAFRGADSQAMPKMIEQLNAKVFELPICYRCPTLHVELAQKYVSSIQPYSGNVRGVIEHIDENLLCNSLTSHLPNRYNDKIYPVYVLCRNNFPLVKPCFELIRNGINATIRGADIGKNLIARIRATKGTKIEEFNKNLKLWMEKEKATLETSDKSTEMLMDKYDTLVVLSEDCDNTDQLIEKISKIFSDKDSAIIFSTIHKVKGFESNMIYVLRPDLMPSSFAKSEEACEQENNVQYISVTRSMNTLIYANKTKE